LIMSQISSPTHCLPCIARQRDRKSGLPISPA